MSLSEDLAVYLAAATPVPDAARRRACEGIADAVGVLLAGRTEDVVRTIASMAAPAVRDDAASLLFGPATARAVDAALVNGTAAHVLAMDDVTGALHPSASLMPALLAEGEAIDASGADVVDAYVAGFEVMAALAEREPDSLHETAWHPTGLLGPIGAAAAVARLRRLPADRCRHALGIAASASGGVQGNFGSETKALHVGRAASAGVWATRLAARGVTAGPGALDGPKGLLQAVSPHGRVDTTTPLATDPARPRLSSTGLTFKKYPVCYTTHRVVDAAIALATDRAIDPARVARIVVRIGRRQAAMARFGVPTTPFEAKYSAPFVVASGLVARAAGLAQLAPDFIASAAIHRLIGVTDVELLDSVQAGEPVFAEADRVIVTLSDGAVFDSGDVAYATGHARAPWSADAHRRKFLECAASTGYDDAVRLYDALMTLDRLPRIRDLAKA